MFYMRHTMLQTVKRLHHVPLDKSDVKNVVISYLEKDVRSDV